MSEYRVIKGSDVVIRANSAIVGGIEKAVITENTQSDDIYQFLTDEPVASMYSSVYELKLYVNTEGFSAFDGKDTLSEVVIINGENGETVFKYLNCLIEKKQVEISAPNELEYVVTVKSREKEVV